MRGYITILQYLTVFDISGKDGEEGETLLEQFDTFEFKKVLQYDTLELLYRGRHFHNFPAKGMSTIFHNIILYSVTQNHSFSTS